MLDFLVMEAIGKQIQQERLTEADNERLLKQLPQEEATPQVRPGMRLRALLAAISVWLRSL